jgi:hypothetical protein
MCLATASVIITLSAKCTLVDFAILSPRKWHPIVFQFNDGSRRLPGHIMDCVLITEPIAALHGVIKMPMPIVGVHVSKCGIYSTLGRNRVGTGRK